MSAVRERRTAPMNGAARIAFVLCVASALSMAVEAETTTYVGYCDDISFLTGSSSQTVQAFDFLQCCSSSLAKGFSYSVATNVGTTYTAKVVKSSSNSGTMFGGHCEVYNGGASCSGSACYEDMNGYYQCKLEQCCWEASADNWCLNVQCRNNDGSACTFNDFSITFDAHTVSCAAGTDYDSARGQYLDGSSCQSCPANSKGAGGTATTCTCAANYWAKKSGSTWTCELCSGGRTKAAGSTILSGSGEVEDDVCISHSDGYGDCECYCDGSYQGKLHVEDPQGGVGVTESFCDNNGPPACPSEGFTCANPNTVNWAYDSTYTGAQFGPSPGDSGPPPGGSTSTQYGDCECYCDGSLQGILPFDDGVPEGFCDNYGPGGGASQCPNMGGFTCANPFTVNWVHNPAYQGTSFSGR